MTGVKTPAARSPAPYVPDLILHHIFQAAQFVHGVLVLVFFSLILPALFVEIRPLFSQTCTARIQKFPDGSGSPQMFLDVSKCVQKFLEVSRCF
eukprot:jgi/Chrzof1/6517/UNPLg00866.t1